MLPFVIVSCFVIFIIAMAIIVTRPIGLRLKIVAAVAALAVTVFMALFYHSWWFVLWAVLLALAIILLNVVINVWWKILLVVVLIAIVLGGFIITLPILRGELPTNPGTEPVPTIPPLGNCTEAIVKESQTHGGKVELDLNDGDPFDYSLTVVNPNVPSGNKTLVVLTDPMYIFDVVHPVMYFTSYRLEGTFDQALCSALKLAGDNALAYVYVGKEATPKGWSTVATNGWWTELVAKQYSEQPITPGGDWAAYQVETSLKTQKIKAETQLVYGQMWNPNNSGTVVHFQIEKGYEFSIPAGWQGTYWTVVNADTVLVQHRLVQASYEVIERDALSIKNVTLTFCGTTVPTTELKIGNDALKWVTVLEGWDCQPTK
jgi:hypothetical protein